MKIRYGFISNSSSTSFVVKADAYPNVFTLAQEMVHCRKNYDESKSKANSYEKTVEWDSNAPLIDKIEQAKKMMDPDMGICFLTCNYDTYILKLGDYYVVSTCNNHDWEGYSDEPDPIKGILHDFPKDVVQKLHDLGMEVDPDNYQYEYLWDDISYHMSTVGNYWYTQYDLIGHNQRELRGRADYAKCCTNKDWNKPGHNDGERIRLMNGDVVCPQCEMEKRE